MSLAYATKSLSYSKDATKNTTCNRPLKDLGNTYDK
jgi:hypothetical protein